MPYEKTISEKLRNMSEKIWLHNYSLSQEICETNLDLKKEPKDASEAIYEVNCNG